MNAQTQLGLKAIVAKNIRERRKTSGLSQEKLAELAGLSRVYISNIETQSKSITIDALENIANSLGCSPQELITK